jgi:hypothetical protein
MRGTRAPKDYRKDSRMTRQTRRESHEHQTDAPHLVTQNSDQYAREGAPIFDMNGERVGDVKMHNFAAGYLMAWTGPFTQHNLYIAFMTQQSSETPVVQSDSDADPRPVDSGDVQNIATRLAVGVAVYDAQGKRLGTTTHYDVARKLLVVESGVFHQRVLFVPFSAIESINPETLSVSLALSKQVALKERKTLPPADA